MYGHLCEMKGNLGGERGGALSQAHPEAARAHREAEHLGHRARRGVELDLEVAGDHAQRRLRLEEGEVAAGAEAWAGAEGEEGLLVGRLEPVLLQPAARVEVRGPLDVAQAGSSVEQQQAGAGRDQDAADLGGDAWTP